MSDQTPELEQFLGIGEGRVIWRLTVTNIVGVVVGFILSQQINTIIGFDGLWQFVMVGLCLFLGFWLTTRHRGIMRLRRWVLLGGLGLRWLVRARTVQTATTTDEDSASYPVRVTRRGTTILDQSRNNSHTLQDH